MGTVANVVILAIIAVCVVFAARRAWRTISGKEDCCHGGAKAPKVKRARVADTDKANYPYATDVKIGGMTCEHCVNTVENAINGLPDTWAQVNLDTKTAHILTKQPFNAEAVDNAVTAAGYYVARNR